MQRPKNPALRPRLPHHRGARRRGRQPPRVDPPRRMRHRSRPKLQPLLRRLRPAVDNLGVATNNQANEWLEHHVLALTLISPFPKLDDPKGKVDVWNGITHKTLRFPFTYAEWESTLIDVFEEALERIGGGFEWALGVSEGRSWGLNPSMTVAEFTALAKIEVIDLTGYLPGLR
jgi:hypothetical protein